MGMLMDGFLQDLSPISYDIVLLVHHIFSSSVILSLTHPLSQIFHIASWDLRGSPDIFCHKLEKKNGIELSLRCVLIQNYRLSANAKVKN